MRTMKMNAAKALAVLMLLLGFWAVYVKKLEADDRLLRAREQPMLCVNSSVQGPPHQTGPRFFREAVFALGKPVSDKVTHHGYEMMYGTFLLPAIHAACMSSQPFRLLEIGLGCGMTYGAGESVKIWRHFLGFPKAEVWEAEYDVECVEKHRQKLTSTKMLDGIVTGDQGNPATLKRWIHETGGNFGAVIDDGGHSNMQIWTSFLHLWPAVAPGGLYFIEDMMAGRLAEYEDSNGKFIMIDVVKRWVDQIVMIHQRHDHPQVHPLPVKMKAVTCFQSSCAILKCDEDDKFAGCLP